MANKLLLCSGNEKRAGWTTLDANPSVAADIVATLPPLPEQVRAIKWETIELIHGIEHFYRWEAIELLKELHEVLVIGGKLILEQPNIEYAAKVMLGIVKPPNSHPERFTMWPLYGDPGNRDELYCHRWGYTPTTLRDSLVRAGFDQNAI